MLLEFQSLVKKNRLTPFQLRGLIFSALVLVTILLYSMFHEELHACPLSGPQSSAPLNEKEFLRHLDDGIDYLKEINQQHKRFDGNVISTCINEEAAIHNFPIFLDSLANVQPPLTQSLLVFCLDENACKICHDLGLNRLQCIFMDLGVAGNSLAPGGSDKQNNDYWRLTYGRVYATVALIRPGINTIPVDVDAIFLQNPFIVGNGIHERPEDIAVVSDIAPFTFQYGDKTPINGGFLYFPGFTKESYQYSYDIINRIWSKNCYPKSNEQLVTSSVLRYYTKKYLKNPNFNPHMLSVNKYLNFCSTNCGTNLEFSSINNINDLLLLDQKYLNLTTYNDCSKIQRKKWVYFHAACLNKDVLLNKNDIAKAKGNIQKAIYTWVKETTI